ncbi:hypothetical protein QOT17_011121 [Balamuthia mandrillaris]
MNETKLLLSLEGLPVDVQLYLFSFLDGASLGRCLMVSRTIQEVAVTPWLWRRLCDDELCLSTQLLSRYAPPTNRGEEETREEEEEDGNSSSDFYTSYKRFHTFKRLLTANQHKTESTTKESAVFGLSSCEIADFYSTVSLPLCSLLSSSPSSSASFSSLLPSSSFSSTSSPSAFPSYAPPPPPPHFASSSSSSSPRSPSPSHSEKEERKKKKLKKLMHPKQKHKEERQSQKPIRTFYQQVSAMQNTSPPTHKAHAVLLQTSRDVLFSGGWDGCIMAWRAADFELLRRYRHSSSKEKVAEVRALLLYQGLLFSGGQDGRVLCWDVSNIVHQHNSEQRVLKGKEGKERKKTGIPVQEEDKTTSLMEMKAHGKAVLGLQVSATGRFLFTSGGEEDEKDATIKVWELSSSLSSYEAQKKEEEEEKEKTTTKKRIAKLVQTIEKAHPGQIMRMAIDRTGSFLFTCCYDGEVKVWTINEQGNTLGILEQRHLLHQSATYMRSLTVSKDNTLLYCCEGSGEVLTWSIPSFQLLRTTQITENRASGVQCLLSVGEYLLAGSRDFKLSIWVVGGVFVGCVGLVCGGLVGGVVFFAANELELFALLPQETTQ